MQFSYSTKYSKQKKKGPEDLVTYTAHKSQVSRSVISSQNFRSCFWQWVCNFFAWVHNIYQRNFIQAVTINVVDYHGKNIQILGKMKQCYHCYHCVLWSTQRRYTRTKGEYADIILFPNISQICLNIHLNKNQCFLRQTHICSIIFITLEERNTGWFSPGALQCTILRQSLHNLTCLWAFVTFLKFLEKYETAQSLEWLPYWLVTMINLIQFIQIFQDENFKNPPYIEQKRRLFGTSPS